MRYIKVLPKDNDFSKVWEYELFEDFELPFGQVIIVVPKYFSYDGATIPSFAWSLIYTPFDPIVMLPALVHDWLYSNHQVERKQADDIFRHLLRNNGVPENKVDTIYRAVRYFGEAAWENTAEDLNYLRWLRQKLLDDGVDIDKYHFPPELALYERFIVPSTSLNEKLFTFRFGMRNASNKEDFVARTDELRVALEAYRQLDLPIGDRSPISGPIERAQNGNNLSWSWKYIDSLWDFKRVVIERCDGRPTEVEKNLHVWLQNIGQFCPWRSYVKSAGEASAPNKTQSRRRTVN